jgi:hypothetical protein
MSETPTQQAILSIIKQIENEKLLKYIEPHYALLSDINAVVRKTLNELYLQGSVKVGDTINDKWISSEINGKEAIK